MQAGVSSRKCVASQQGEERPGARRVGAGLACAYLGVRQEFERSWNLVVDLDARRVDTLDLDSDVGSALALRRLVFFDIPLVGGRCLRCGESPHGRTRMSMLSDPSGHFLRTPDIRRVPLTRPFTWLRKVNCCDRAGGLASAPLWTETRFVSIDQTFLEQGMG